MDVSCTSAQVADKHRERAVEKQGSLRLGSNPTYVHVFFATCKVLTKWKHKQVLVKRMHTK